MLALPLAVVALGIALRLALVASGRASVTERLPEPGGGGSPWSAPGRAPSGGGRRFGLWLPRPPSWLASTLADAAIDIPAGTAWRGWIGAVVVVPSLVAALAGPAVALLALLAAGGLPPLALRSRRGRADGLVEKELPAALEAIARSLRSGASVRQAIGEAARPGGGGGGGGGGGPGAGPRSRRARGGSQLQAELATVADHAGHGTALVEALEGLAARRPGPGVRLAVAALCLGVDTGGAQARAVDGVAATIRERLAVEAEVRALSSQARMSALVIGLAPLGFGVFAAATDPRTSDFLLRTPGGLVLLVTGLLLDGAGWLWMQRLCRVPT